MTFPIDSVKSPSSSSPQKQSDFETLTKEIEKFLQEEEAKEATTPMSQRNITVIAKDDQNKKH